jgi:hypothetical protein
VPSEVLESPCASLSAKGLQQKAFLFTSCSYGKMCTSQVFTRVLGVCLMVLGAMLHLEAQSAVFAHLRQCTDRVKLDILDRMTQSTAASIAYSHMAGHFNDRHLFQQSLCVAAMLTMQVLWISYECNNNITLNTAAITSRLLHAVLTGDAETERKTAG